MLSLAGLGLVFAVAASAGGMYCLGSRKGAQARLLKAMHATSLDPSDR